MKRVLLIGDSIRMGYDDFVKEEMPDYEVIYDPDDNGRFSDYSIWMFHQFYKKYKTFDYVHFNAGYWDMNIEGPDGKRQTSPEDYVKNLKRLIDEIRMSGAIPIFANTIPICDKLSENKDYLYTNYVNSWVLEYNDLAEKLMKEENVTINDLYSLCLKGENYYKCNDSLHLTEEGYRKCAKQVADLIRKLDK